MYKYRLILRQICNYNSNQSLFKQQKTYTTMSERNRKVAVCQMTSTSDKEKNYNIVTDLIKKAKSQNASMVFLPEGCDYIAKDSSQNAVLCEDDNGPLIKNYCSLAKTNNIWISIGGFHEKATENKMFNTHYIINNEGHIVDKYQKLHLFDVNLDENKLQESKSVCPGLQINEPVATPVGNVGLAICYDVRFPELSTLLRKAGAEVLTYPSAFTHETGALHWETLLRARAVENQCYVLAAAQVGYNHEARVSYGRAMIVDPLGRIVAQCSENDNTSREPEIIFGEIDQSLIQQVRKKMPVFEHRRNDIYTLFGNIKNVLVATKRVARRLTDLQQNEIADLFQTVIKVQKIMEEAHSCSSSTVVVQDGKDAGQTVPHVHVHILPRKEGDFQNNDDIYDSLARHDQPESKISRRTDDEMEREAAMLKPLFFKRV